MDFRNKKLQWLLKPYSIYQLLTNKIIKKYFLKTKKSTLGTTDFEPKYVSIDSASPN